MEMKRNENRCRLSAKTPWPSTAAEKPCYLLNVVFITKHVHTSTKVLHHPDMLFRCVAIVTVPVPNGRLLLTLFVNIHTVTMRGTYG